MDSPSTPFHIDASYVLATRHATLPGLCRDNQCDCVSAFMPSVLGCSTCSSSCVTVTPFPNLLLRARRMSMPVRVEDFRLCVPVTQSSGTRSSHLALWRICAGSIVQLLDCQKTCILCNCRRALGSPPAGLFAAPREQKMCTTSMDTKCPGLYS